MSERKHRPGAKQDVKTKKQLRIGNQSRDFSRRSFLGGAVGAGLTCALDTAGTSDRLGHRLYLGLQSRTRIPTPDEFRRKVTGGIVDIPTPFTADFKVDFDGLRRIIRRALAEGFSVYELTYGDGRLWSLSPEELRQVARTIVETVGDKGVTIICGHSLWTSPIIDFARYLESIGASALQLVLPNYGDEDSKVKYFEDIARSTKLSLVLRGNLEMPLLSRLMKIDTIVAMKHDVSEIYLREVLIHYRNRLNSYAGGSWEWFLGAQPWGAKATLDTYATLAPELSARFWKAVDGNDQATARMMIEKYEHPLLRHGFTAAFWRAGLEYFGIAARYVRPPERSFTDQQMASVKQLFDELGVYPET